MMLFETDEIEGDDDGCIGFDIVALLVKTIGSIVLETEDDDCVGSGIVTLLVEAIGSIEEVFVVAVVSIDADFIEKISLNLFISTAVGIIPSSCTS